jgi:hypothetical protein
VLQQFVPGDAGVADCLGLTQPVKEGAVGQFRGDDEEAIELPGAEDGQEVSVADALHDLEGAQLRFPRSLPKADQLQGDVEAAGPVGPPDLAEAPAAQRSDQLVIGQGALAPSEEEAPGRGLLWRVGGL